MRAFKIIGVLLLGACTPVATTAPDTGAGQAALTAPAMSTAMDLEAASRGRAIALLGCASCHAIDPAGDSPRAIAPPFREIVQRRGSDDLARAFEQGLVTTHPAMPPYVFRANEIHDLTAYLDTLRAAGGGTSKP
ncbi:c-type cytochrome [Brevundimonas aurifodinae]|uniref:C-type cytochrome n=1 Tax=Brevundimonas aurifodinae TaxID=1508312 RepID=A0ABV1NK69_9CAUL